MRTDLAVESKSKTENIPGIREMTEERDGLNISRIDVTDTHAAEMIDKPIGRYITITVGPNDVSDHCRRKQIAEALANELKTMVNHVKSAMVIGLGNRYVTADALGTKTAEYVLVTRHVYLHLRDLLPKGTPITSAFCANVLGVTGMETAEVVTALTEQIKPDVVILVDSLAAASVRHIGCVIQCNDSGIAPGSGVGNFRTMLTRELLKVPVIAIGVPTVVSAETIVRDSGAKSDHPEELRDLIVAPKDIDALIRDLSRILSDAINMMLFGESYPDLEQLLR